MLNVIEDLVNDIKESTNYDFSNYEKSFLAKSIQNRCNKVGASSLLDYKKIITYDSNELEYLNKTLLIDYSEFFRNPLTFANLEQWIIPCLIKQKNRGQEIRIWSAGCACGQEAYSIAMLVDKFKTRLMSDVNYRIIATDISEHDLDYAMKGIYTGDQISNVRFGQIREYFKFNNGNYEIIDRIKKNVSFSYYDLLDNESLCPQESIFGNFDIVFCSNLLFYYREDIQQKIISKMCRSLSGNGFLVTGEAERHSILHSTNLHMVSPPLAIFHK